MTSSSTTLDARTLLWTPSDSIRDANRRKIIRAVMVDPMTQVNVARFTGLSQATVSGLVNELVQENILRVDTGNDNERGKNLRIAKVRGVAIGIEVNHNELTVAARRVDNSSVEYETAAFGTDQGGNAWVRESARLIRDLATKTGLDTDHVVSIGLGIPAAIDPRTGGVTQVAASLDWDLAGDPKQRFRDHFPHVPVTVDNEANLAAYGEYVYGVGRTVETMFFVKASTSLGAGLVTNGTIYRGRHGLSGEIGHLTMDVQGTVCRCGNRGCLDTIVGGNRLVEQVRQAYSGYRMDLPTSLEGMIERAKAGDQVCTRILQDASRDIGLALARVANLLNPDIMVLGGELGRASDLLIGPASYEMGLYSLRGMHSHAAPIKLVGSELGLLAGARGALAFALRVDSTVTV
ncbi:ROK family transcriptional regulator [Actinophytocola sediminis]